jgi:hypothetical protein
MLPYLPKHNVIGVLNFENGPKRDFNPSNLSPLPPTYNVQYLWTFVANPKNEFSTSLRKSFAPPSN